MIDNIDCLAVMDTVDACLHQLQMNPDTKAMHIARFTEARSAVAELIEADKEYDSAKRGLGSDGPENGFGYDRLLAAIARRDVAISRVKGDN